MDNISKVYESDQIHCLLGSTLRPGKYELLEAGIKCCGIKQKELILDIGCGMGATLSYLDSVYHMKGVGIDPSEYLLEKARKNFPEGEFIKGDGEHIPFEEKTFHLAICECSLSLMTNTYKALKEAYRVLKPGGYLIIEDVYAKRPEFVKMLRETQVITCVRGLHHLDDLKEDCRQIGFLVLHEEDRTDLLKELMVKIIFSYGSMDSFWLNTSDDSINDCCSFQTRLKACKPGYFFLILKKGVN